MPFEGDPLAYYGRNVVQDYHDTLKKRIPFTIPDVFKLPSRILRPPIAEEKVGILGAGVGGLYTALILDSLDIKYEILEASDRTGGRLFTYKFPNGGKYDYYDVGAMRYPLPKKDDQGKYKNGVMKRLGELIEYAPLNQGSVPLKSTLIPYYYTTKPGSSPGFLFFNGQRKRTTDPTPDFNAKAMRVEPEYITAGVTKIVDDVVQPFARMIVGDMLAPEGTVKKGWEVMRANDAYSTRAYMSFKYIPSFDLNLPPSHLSTNVINWCEMLDKSSGWYDRGLTETVLEALAFAKAGDKDFSEVDWKCFDGGSHTLIKYMEDYVNGTNGRKKLIHFGKRVTAISTDPLRGLGLLTRKGVSRADIDRMIVEGVTAKDLELVISKGVTREDVEEILANTSDDEVDHRLADDVTFEDVNRRIFGNLSVSVGILGVKAEVSLSSVGHSGRLILDDLRRLIERLRRIRGIRVSVAGEAKPRAYSHVISTLPLPCLRTIDMAGAKLSVMQRTALRQLQYGPSIKIGMRFKEPWWTTKLGIVGGQSFTDLPVRTIVYPSYGVDSKTPPNVLIASYCWTNDAERMGSLIGTGSDERLKELVLWNLVKVHGGDITYDFLKGQLLDMHAWDWNHNPLTMGAFAFFGPGDFQDLYTSLSAPAADNCLHFAGEAMSTRHAWVVGALDSAWRAVNEYLLTSGQEDKIPKFKRLWGENLEWTTQPSEAAPSDAKDPSNLLRGHLGYIDAAISAGILEF